MAYLMLGSSALKLQQKCYLNEVLEVVGCHISVVKALVATTSGPGFDSPATIKIVSHYSFTFFQTPKVSI